MGNKLLFEPISDIMGGTSPLAGPTEQSMSSLEMSKISELYSRMKDEEILQIKRTAAAKAKIVNKVKIPPISFKPKMILPGSLQQFSIKVDKNSYFKISSWLNKKLKLPEEYFYNADVDSSRQMKKPVDEKTGKIIIHAIWLTQKYIGALCKRIELNGKYSLNDDVHVLVPSALYDTIIAIEEVIDNVSDFSELTNCVAALETWLNGRILNFKLEMEKLVGYVANEESVSLKNLPSELSKESSEKIEPIFGFHKDWADRATVKFFIGSLEPNEFNRSNLFTVIENLLNDFLLPIDGWITKTKFPANTGKLIDNFTLRIGGDNNSYAEVLQKLGPVQKALEKEMNNPEKAKKCVEASAICKVISAKCTEKFSVEKVITSPVSKLLDEINNIISEIGLNKLMLDEIKDNFKAYYETLTKDSEELKPKDLEDNFHNLNEIKRIFDKAREKYRETRKLLEEHSTTSDIDSITENSEQKISKALGGISTVMSTKNTLESLRSEANKAEHNATDNYDELFAKLSENSSEQSVFWVGLGQAGGQIQRACILYCLNNLSDARCRGLISSLGATGEDMQKIRNQFKDIYSSDVTKKKMAEDTLKDIFHKNIHLLAINLGEEVDKLTKSDQPGYYLWGKDEKHDGSTSVSRNKRNILKLKPKGEGAGGETGVGRAYGFRFETEITEVLRDVGKKGRGTPRHIIITHSLAGGSGSGMVLPVLQQVRETFGSEAAIWVVSVGEGASESKSVAKINTPFIISDILQATYAGIHAIEDPIDLSDWRLFRSEVQSSAEQMEKKCKELIKILQGEKTDGKWLTNLSTMFDNGFKQRYLETSTKWEQSFSNLKQTSVGETGKEGISLNGISSFDSQISKHEYLSLVKSLCEILPDHKDKAIGFSSWCKEQSTKGDRPASEFWTNWWRSIYDPLSLLLDGRTAQHKTARDQSGDEKKDYFSAAITATHLKNVMGKLHSTFGIKNERDIVPDIVPHVSPGMNPLINKIESIIENKSAESKKEMLLKIGKILKDYGLALGTFNKQINDMTLRILALSGSSGDKLVKSILVSNAHLEKGVNDTNDLVASGNTYTVYNSVIFDLLLNIIGPSLESEKGVWKVMDEEIDHMDLIKGTPSPLVIGLLNHRDSTSLREAPEAGNIGAIKPDVIQRVIKSMFTVKNVNPDSKNVVENAMYLDHNTMTTTEKFVGSFFGSRLKYMLQTNPYNTLINSEFDFKDLELYCEKLEEIWDNSDEKSVFEVQNTTRENLLKIDGFSGKHISNLARWFSLIDPSMLSKFVTDEPTKYEEIMNNTGKIWKMLGGKDRNNKFDIGILRTDTSVPRYLGKDSPVNRDQLYSTLPTMGIHNTDILRSIGPAYLNSYLPIELLNSINVEGNIAEKLDYKSFGLERETFEAKVKPTSFRNIHGLAKAVIQYSKENHTSDLNGEVKNTSGWVSSLNNSVEKEFQCILDYYDLEIVMQGSSYYLRNHPRISRFFSVVRDIPIGNSDSLLPARSAAASLSRYIRANSGDDPLDPEYIPKNRNGIASPTFAFGSHILNYMRFMNLLPDEKSITLVPLLRILLLGTGSQLEFKRNLGTQLKLMGLDLEKYSPNIDEIYNHKYHKVEIINEPSIYSSHLSTLLKRIHAVGKMMSDLVNDMPLGWSNSDLKGIEFLQNEVLSNEEIAFESIENIDETFRNVVESIPYVKIWIQDVMQLVIQNHSPENSSDIDDDEDEDLEEVKLEVDDEEAEELEEVDDSEHEQENATVSTESSTVVRVKQLFYDIAYYFNESLGQAEYSSTNDKSKIVHFEMTGFSDRLIGKPENMLTLIHDRNHKLPLGTISQNTRDSISYGLGVNLGQVKEFGTSSDFGPTSYATVVLGGAPAADISDQFQMLMLDPEKGLNGDNPYWAFEQSKIHPYMFLYNILWLSCNVNQWTDPGNKEFIRRLQIPTSVIKNHFLDPERLGSEAIKFEKDKTAFSNGVKMPKQDKNDYASALDGKLTGHRNILKLLGIMALRYGNSWDSEKAKSYSLDNKKLTSKQYQHLFDELSSDAYALSGDQLFNEEQPDSPVEKNPFMVFSSGSGNVGGDEDNIETRAKAWFDAYSIWLNYSKNHPGRDKQNEERPDEASKFEANLESSDE